ncbi:MAG: hypothetical protein O7A98_08915, partial [Acidobacteria bacterium]|nr:hypothetical protein [Acidobacteriota bacterium]
GAWITYVSDESGSAEIYLRRFPAEDGKWQLSTGGGGFPIWSAAGDRIYFLQGRDLMEVEIALRPSLSVGRPKMLFTWELAGQGYAIADDGQRFVMVEPVGTNTPRPIITVVENWFREFEQGN